MSIISTMIGTPRHYELTDLKEIDGKPLIAVPTGAASLLVLCADSQVLAIKVMGLGELLHTIRQRQFDGELLKLREQSPWAYLLITGVMVPNVDGKVRIGNTVSGWSWASVQGALLSAQEMGVGVLSLQHAQHIPDMVTTLARRERRQKRVRPPRDTLWTDPASDLLQALPGIGEEKADAILSSIDKAAWALAALTDDTYQIDGIGTKTRAGIKAALGLRDDERLIVSTWTNDEIRQERTNDGKRTDDERKRAA